MATIRERAVVAVEAAINRQAEASGSASRVKLDPQSAKSNGGSRAAGYDCVSWEVFGYWQHENCTTAACVGVWDTMTACARHPNRVAVVSDGGLGWTEVCVDERD